MSIASLNKNASGYWIEIDGVRAYYLEADMLNDYKYMLVINSVTGEICAHWPRLTFEKGKKQQMQFLNDFFREE